MIRYEKDSLKDYILYEIPDTHIYPIISADNGFQICYMNNPNETIRLFFKIILYDKDIKFFIEDIFDFINIVFKTSSEQWTITINQRMVGSNHIIHLYFFSNIFSIKLNNLKKIMANIFYPDIHFDDSIYYKTHNVYKDIISIHLPNQTDYSMKKNYIYKLLMGNPKHMIITNIENLNEYEL
jgi:hypothetical protein